MAESRLLDVVHVIRVLLGGVRLHHIRGEEERRREHRIDLIGGE